MDGIVDAIGGPLVSLLQCKTPGLQMPAPASLCQRAFSGSGSHFGPTLSRPEVPVNSCSQLSGTPNYD